jgi:hypothetical protein
MSTTDNILLIIITTLLSLLLIASLMVTLVIFKLLATVKRVVVKAEEVIDSVESATDVLKDVKSNMSVFKLILNIVKLVQKGHK